MSERPSAGIGKRLAKYRKLADLSARELSEKIGGELSRGVIANIESGRKTDVTIDQLIALSWALGVPPAALALPIDEPYKFVRMTDDQERRESFRAYRVTEWFQNEKAFFREVLDMATETPAGALAQETITAVREYPRLQNSYTRVKSLLAEGKADEGMVRERELELLNHERYLRQLGVDFNVFRVDE